MHGCGYSDALVTRCSVGDVREGSERLNEEFYDRNRQVYELLRYGVKVKLQ